MLGTLDFTVSEHWAPRKFSLEHSLVQTVPVKRHLQRLVNTVVQALFPYSLIAGVEQNGAVIPKGKYKT